MPIQKLDRGERNPEGAQTPSRRTVLKMGAALAAVPLNSRLQFGSANTKVFSTGSSPLDQSLAGGLRLGTVLAVVGPRGGGKTAFMLRLARANGIMDAYPMSVGTSDMLSIMEREDGNYIGSLMLDSAEPATDKERADMARDPAARDAFLTRWLKRTCEVMRGSGGLLAISVCHDGNGSFPSGWMSIPDYLISVNGAAESILRRV